MRQKFDPIMTKTEKLRHLRARGTTADLRVASALLNQHRSSRATVAVASEWRSEKREKKGGSSSGFIGRERRCVDGKGAGRGRIGSFPYRSTGAVACRTQARHYQEQERKARVRGRKGRWQLTSGASSTARGRERQRMRAANVRDQRGSEREKEQRVQPGVGAWAGRAEQA